MVKVQLSILGVLDFSREDLSLKKSFYLEFHDIPGLAPSLKDSGIIANPRQACSSVVDITICITVATAIYNKAIMHIC